MICFLRGPKDHINIRISHSGPKGPIQGGYQEPEFVGSLCFYIILYHTILYHTILYHTILYHNIILLYLKLQYMIYVVFWPSLSGILEVNRLLPAACAATVVTAAPAMPRDGQIRASPTPLRSDCTATTCRFDVKGLWDGLVQNQKLSQKTSSLTWNSHD